MKIDWLTYEKDSGRECVKQHCESLIQVFMKELKAVHRNDEG